MREAGGDAGFSLWIGSSGLIVPLENGRRVGLKLEGEVVAPQLDVLWCHY